MALNYHPRQGEVLMCDFGAGGFKEPEMVKKRPVVVLSPKRFNSVTCIVVPLSATAPRIHRPFHHRMKPESLPRTFKQHVSWVKGDMITHVALSRLDRVMYRRSSDNGREYETTIVCPEDWTAIQACVRHSLGLHDGPPTAERY